jgi:Zn finger protein HypA/HybF involved in hydrogenase expression
MRKEKVICPNCKSEKISIVHAKELYLICLDCLKQTEIKTSNL